jgi:hypothetical protein
MREAEFHTILGDRYKSDAREIWAGFVTEDSKMLCGWSLMEEAKVRNVFTTSTLERLEGDGLDSCAAVMEARRGEIYLHIWE